MSELEVAAIEGTVVDETRRFDRLCQGMVESMTEFDWEDGPHAIPGYLRDALRDWCWALNAWSESR